MTLQERVTNTIGALMWQGVTQQQTIDDLAAAQKALQAERDALAAKLAALEAPEDATGLPSDVSESDMAEFVDARYDEARGG